MGVKGTFFGVGNENCFCVVRCHVPAISFGK